MPNTSEAAEFTSVLRFCDMAQLLHANGKFKINNESTLIIKIKKKIKLFQSAILSDFLEFLLMF